jgi:hypothetical protein
VSDLACSPSKHKEMKESPELMATDAEFIGTQHEVGHCDLDLWNCKTCRSTISVRVNEREVA